MLLADTTKRWFVNSGINALFMTIIVILMWFFDLLLRLGILYAIITIPISSLAIGAFVNGFEEND